MEKGIGKEKTAYRFGAEMLIVIQSLVYGFGDPISKIAFEIVPVYSMMTVRYSIAFLFCAVIFASSKKNRKYPITCQSPFAERESSIRYRPAAYFLYQ